MRESEGMCEFLGGLVQFAFRKRPVVSHEVDSWRKSLLKCFEKLPVVMTRLQECQSFTPEKNDCLF